MSLIWVVIIVFVAWWLSSEFKKSKHQSEHISTKNNSDHPISEEYLFKAQTVFEKKLEQTFLPDAISGQEIYIYSNLINPWFQKLASENRYDDNKVNKLRIDFLDYMEALEDRRTYNYLSLEAEDKSAEEAYYAEHIVASRKVFAIEAGFAAAIGEDAVKELNHVRELGYSSFSNRGERAPEGSIYDLEEKLVPVKKPTKKT